MPLTDKQKARVEALFDAAMDPELPGHTFGQHLTANTIYRAVTILDAPLRELIKKYREFAASANTTGVDTGALWQRVAAKAIADELSEYVLPEASE